MSGVVKALIGFVIVVGIGVLLYLGFMAKDTEQAAKKSSADEQAAATAADAAKGAHIDVRVRAGGEKMGLLQDPKLTAVLRDRYHLTVAADKAGSVEMARDLPVQGFDAIWPANEFCRELLVERASREGFQLLRTEDVFNSPIVILSWPDPVRVFSGPAWNIVQRRSELYQSVDLAKLVDLVEKEKKWKDPDIGLPYHGKVIVKSTDPVKSSSGNLFAGLVANVMNGGDAATKDSVIPILPRLTAFFGRMGLKEESSGTFFEHFLGQGVGAYPFGVAYENQLIELAMERPESADAIRQNVVVLYPEPTVWATHPLIALTAGGRRLIDAMKDPEVQEIAWKGHGFRSSSTGSANDPSAFQMRGIPQQIVSAMPLPEPAAMTKILEALGAK